MTQTAVTTNTANSNGGGLYNHGGSTINISETQISGNSANNGNGGGIYNNGNTTLTTSTISNNSAANNGGGIHNQDNLTMQNSTVSGNSSNHGAAIGIINAGSVNMTHVTVSDNTVLNSSAANNGAVRLSGVTASLTMVNSIIANTVNDADCAISNGIVTDNGNNLVEDGSCISASSSISGDPVLGALANNGGSTLTHALLDGSPAIDAANTAACLATDQNGTARPIGAACDIGAHESTAQAGSSGLIYLPIVMRP